MSFMTTTVTADPQPERPAPVERSPKLIKAYQKAVAIAAESGDDEVPATEVLAEWGRTSIDWVEDRNRWRSRSKAVPDLSRAEKMLEEAAAIVVPEPPDLRKTPLASLPTVEDLLAVLERIENPAQILPPERLKQAEMRRIASGIRAEASRVLAATVSAEHRREVTELRDRIQSLQQAVDGFQDGLTRGQNYAELVHDLDRLARTKPTPPKEQIDAARTKTAAVPQFVIRKVEVAGVGIRKAEREIVKLQSQQAKLAKKANAVNNMLWNE